MQSNTDFFIIRTPLLSMEWLVANLSQDNLAQAIQDPLVGEAIRMASPTFFAQWQRKPEIANPKLRQTALKYLLRMGSRCTPFGLFAGCSMGLVASASDFDLSRRQLSLYHWLDAQLLWAIATYLNHHSVLRSHIRYRPNSSLYLIGKQLRYTELVPHPTGKMEFSLSQLDASRTIRIILRLARRGATRDELIQGLTKKGYTESEAHELVEHLIVDQVLSSEISPNVTGPDCLSRYIAFLNRIPAGETVLTGLKQIQSLLMDQSSIADKEAAIHTILTQQLGVEVPEGSSIQTDTLFRNTKIELNRSVWNQIQATITKLAPLTQLNDVSHLMREFRHRFYARYEEREVPLMIALDSDIGIGYGNTSAPYDSALVRTLHMDDYRPKGRALPNELQHWLFQRYTNWLEQGNAILFLTDEDIDALPAYKVSPLDSCYAFGYFLAESAEAIDQGNYRFKLNALSGPSAFTLMGRFCRDDAGLSQQIKTAFAQQQQADNHRVYAEIVHLPVARMGNVVQRPHLRAYEIPYLAVSILPQANQIALDDLWISVPNGERVILRSKRLNKEIVPALTTAHSHQLGLPLYQFLGDLQQAEQSLMVRWNWGDLNQRRSLPRVQYEQIILTEASWRLEVSDIDPSLPDEMNIQNWRLTWRIPRYVAMTQGDQELFLDLNAVLCQELLIATLGRLKTLRLIEWLRTLDQCPIEGAEGRLTHEVVLPFSTAQLKLPQATHTPVESSIDRSFLPGSEWLYLKVYCGYQAAQSVLGKLGKLARKFMGNGQITHWFFIRYQDPEVHLRIRFHLSSQADTIDVLSSCRQALQPLVRTHEVHRLQVDTYQQEVERYGQHRMAFTEWLFWVDSETVFQLSQTQPSEADQLMAAVMGIDGYLTDFNLTPAEKLAFCQTTFSHLFTECGASNSTQRLLAQTYRNHEQLVRRILTYQYLSNLEKKYSQLFKQRSRRIKPFIASVLAEPNLPLHYVGSVVHMFVNRLFTHQQRTYELVVFQLLRKAYRSLLVQAD